MPDLTWFYCQLAAGQGSQTTVCDGYEVWDRLSEDAKLAFAAQDIVYSRTVLEQAWRTMAHHLLVGVKSYDEVTLDDLQGFLQDAEATARSAPPTARSSTRRATSTRSTSTASDRHLRGVR